MLSKQRLEEVRGNLITWYTTKRSRLIKVMEEAGAVGTVKLSPSDQVERFLHMTDEEWQQELYRIGLRYKGLPNEEELVTTDVQDFLSYIREHLQRSVS